MSRLQKLHKRPENPPLILPQTVSDGTHSSVCMDWVFSGVLWVGVGTRASAEGASEVLKSAESILLGSYWAEPLFYSPVCSRDGF